ncbi:MAG: DUF507 family protein [Deltaproteobacteria bacterium]|nr:DUF507 family protein [Deltaproteobacteria bacterium]
MKLFSGKIGIIAAEIASVLIGEKDIETESPAEVELDVEAVLKEYLRTDRDLTEKAKDLCEQRGLPFSAYLKVKKQLSDQRGFVVGDEATDYIMEQIIRSFMHSQFVEEIFSEDHELKRKMRTVIKRHTDIEEEIDEEVRNKIKNLTEGTRDWEIEYGRVLANVKKRKGLE